MLTKSFSVIVVVIYGSVGFGTVYHCSFSMSDLIYLHCLYIALTISSVLLIIVNTFQVACIIAVQDESFQICAIRFISWFVWFFEITGRFRILFYNLCLSDCLVLLILWIYLDNFSLYILSYLIWGFIKSIYWCGRMIFKYRYLILLGTVWI